MTPSVSVVIPTYNQASFLPEAVASVRAQEFPNLEIIVVDDGSTDDTSGALERLSGEGKLQAIRQENAGAAAARNRGISAARGDWIAFLDADDFWFPGKLSAQFDALRRSPKAGFCYTDVLLRLKNGEERHHKSPMSGPLLLELLTGNYFATPTVLVRRDCFEKVGTFNAELRTGEDWDMWLRLSSHFDSVWVPQPLSLVRVSPVDLLKHSVEAFERCTLRVIDRLYACEHIQRHWPEVAAKRRLVYAWHYAVLAKSYLRQRSFSNFCRLAARSVWAHPVGACYVAGFGRMKTP